MDIHKLDVVNETKDDSQSKTRSRIRDHRHCVNTNPNLTL